jgi:hypothetical protein
MTKNVHLALFAACTALVLAGSASAQASGKPDTLLVSASPYKRLASEVRYAGKSQRAFGDEQKVRSRLTADRFVIAGTAYYRQLWMSGLNYEGLISQDLADGSWTVYPLFRLAIAAGWYAPAGKADDEYLPDSPQGVFRVGDTLWIGSNGVGVLAFDASRKLWSRYDVKTTPILGDHATVRYADEEYLFVVAGEFPNPSLHVYSMKRDAWLRLRAVPTTSVSSYGWSDGLYQVSWDHRPFATKDYLPIDWSLAHPHELTGTADGSGYRFDNPYSKRSRTTFTVSRAQLARAFDTGPTG